MNLLHRNLIILHTSKSFHKNIVLYLTDFFEKKKAVLELLVFTFYLNISSPLKCIFRVHLALITPLFKLLIISKHTVKQMIYAFCCTNLPKTISFSYFKTIKYAHINYIYQFKAFHSHFSPVTFNQSSKIECLMHTGNMRDSSQLTVVSICHLSSLKCINNNLNNIFTWTK